MDPATAGPTLEGTQECCLGEDPLPQGNSIHAALQSRVAYLEWYILELILPVTLSHIVALKLSYSQGVHYTR